MQQAAFAVKQYRSHRRIGALQDVLATLWTQEDQPLIGQTLPMTAGDVLADPR